MSNDEDDRRAAPRVEGIVVVQFDEEGSYGVTRDVSDRGLLIATPTRFAVGDKIELSVHMKSGVHHTRARVVRVEETPPSETWKYKMAVELSDAVPGIVEDGAQAAARFLGRASQIPPSR